MAGKGTSGENQVRPLKEASVLVVEDHAFVLDILERMLKTRVGGLHGARSAEDALYNLEKTPGLAHVAIVDFHLLGMNGVRFVEKLRQSKVERLKTLPVIFMTGENNMDVYRDAAHLGISAYLIKPVAAATLIEALEGALAGRRVAVPRIKGDPAAIIPPPLKRPPRATAPDAPPPVDAPPSLDEAPPPQDPIDFKA